MKRPIRYIIVLLLPDSVPELIVRARHVILAMTNNSWFPSPNPSLAVATAATDELASTEVDVQKGGKGAAATRNVAKKKLVGVMRALQAHAQTVIDQNGDDAAAIAESIGMSLKQRPPRQKPALEAVTGKTPNEVLVRAKAARKRAAYEWQHSADGGETWTTIGTTTVAETSLAGLAVGTTHHFRFRTTIAKTTGPWSPSASIFVVY